jgi:hypothetical protein
LVDDTESDELFKFNSGSSNNKFLNEIKDDENRKKKKGKRCLISNILLKENVNDKQQTKMKLYGYFLFFLNIQSSLDLVRPLGTGKKPH